jgi:hypothetical protein
MKKTKVKKAMMLDVIRPHLEKVIALASTVHFSAIDLQGIGQMKGQG